MLVLFPFSFSTLAATQSTQLKTDKTKAVVLAALSPRVCLGLGSTPSYKEKERNWFGKINWKVKRSSVTEQT